MSEILFLCGAPAGADALRRAVQRDAASGVFHTLRQARGWPELAAWAARPGAARLAFVDPYHGGAFAASEIRRLRERVPGLEMVALGDLTRCAPSDAFTLARLGVREIVCVRERDAAARVAAALATHLNRGAMEETVASLSGRVPISLLRWLQPFLLSPGEGATVGELARGARCSPRTLRRALRAAGLPGPDEMVAWRRLLHAGRLLDDGRSADSVARAMGFSTGSALRKCLKRHTGLRPGDLRREGALAAVSAAFLGRCDGARPGPAPALALSSR